MTITDLTAVPGVAECSLDADTLARVPATAPPAPWDCALDGVIWCSRGGRAATRAVGPMPVGRPLPAVIGGFLSYSDTPVGRYTEVFGAVAVTGRRRPRGTVPFMAVDSPASLVGGRVNWSLPKCLAEFTGEPGDRTLTARGAGWTVAADVRPFGPPFPVRLAGRMVQPGPDGRPRAAVLTGRGRARIALVTVDVASGGELAQWLHPGRHLGAVLSNTRFHLSAAR